MTFTHTQTISTPFGTLQDEGQVFTGAASSALEDTYPSVTTDAPFAMAFSQAGFVCMALMTTTATTVHNYANSAFTSSLAPSILGFVTSISEDVDEVLVDATTGGTLKVRLLYDPTP